MLFFRFYDIQKSIQTYKNKTYRSLKLHMHNQMISLPSVHVLNVCASKCVTWTIKQNTLLKLSKFILPPLTIVIIWTRLWTIAIVNSTWRSNSSSFHSIQCQKYFRTHFSSSMFRRKLSQDSDFSLSNMHIWMLL